MTTKIALLAVLVLSVPWKAHAELVFFGSGRTMSVKAHRVDGESLVLYLRNGGEIVCERSIIARIEPDEVPYPEPEASANGADTKGDAVSGLSDAPAPYREMIDQIASEHGVPARLVKAVIQVESAYKPRAKSRKGAMGLMQLMPETARQYAVADPYDVRANIEAG